jgi:nitrite reductase/ring-hydroxylating ferredoxin subunit
MKHEAWRREFPIAWEDEQVVTRRAFAKSLAAACATCAAGSLLVAGEEARLLAAPAQRIASASELAVGGGRVVAYPGPDDACLLLRLAEDTFVAFAQRCTHLGCPVYFRAGERVLHCPCHEGYFDALDGSVLGGPPRRPLPRVILERRGDELWALGFEMAGSAVE